MLINQLWLFLLLVPASLSRHTHEGSASSNIQCKDENGKNVDWYVVYKIPRNDLFGKHEYGSKYMYITSDTVDQGWTVSQKTMEDNTNIMATTFERMYVNNEEELWMVYNDQPSKLGGMFSFGHTKGVLGGDANGGFWLVHSIPHFPTLESYVYPPNAYRNGQSALCITLDAKQLDRAGNALKYNNPDYQKSVIAESLATIYPTLKSASNGEIIKSAPWFHKLNLTSRGGVDFQGFAKSSMFGKDLYEWVAADLDTDLYAETWPIEIHKLPSSCSRRRKVINVNAIEYKPASISFHNTKDHSKWAISTSEKNPFVCIGDINRALPQEKRGGGTVCMSNEKLWRAYNDIISGKDSCDE